VKQLFDDKQRVYRPYRLAAVNDGFRADQIAHGRTDNTGVVDESAAGVEDGVQDRNRNALNLLVGIAVGDLSSRSRIVVRR
jgi:hypothetical protein